MRITANSEITQVTVYSNQALVTRKALVEVAEVETDTTVSSWRREIAIADLPPTLQSDSIRVTGQGTVAVNLIAVRTETIVTLEDVDPRIAEIEAQIKDLERQHSLLNDQIASIGLQQNFITNLSELAIARFSRSLAKQQVTLDQTDALINFIKQNYDQYSQNLANVNQQQQELDEQIALLHRQKGKLGTSRQKESLNIIITIETEVAGQFELEISYLVSQASWTPLYDLQVNSETKTLNLGYLAEVKQRTGEDWHNVSLILSTAKPGLGSLPPKLEPWYLDLPSPPPPPVSMAAAPMPKSAPGGGMARLAKKMALNMDAMSFGATEEAPEAEFDDEFALDAIAVTTINATVVKEGSVVTFDVGGGSDIPSDGSPHKVTIFREQYPCQLQYIAMPKLVSFAYLQAKVINPSSGVTLLPGIANIFRDYTFVGTSNLDNIAPGQEFKLNLGIDEGFKIERELIERQVDKTLMGIGNQRRITFAYRLKITNLLPQTQNLLLSEQIPVSRNEKIKIRLTQTNPKIELGEMGLLDWKLQLNPQETSEITYQFAVEYPSDISLRGLDI